MLKPEIISPEMELVIDNAPERVEMEEQYVEDDAEIEIVPDGTDIGLANEIGAAITALDVPFDANLVVFLSDDARNTLAEELIQLFDIDLRSRREWEETYKDGLELLGLTTEERTCPWDGAFGAYHPLLTEAVVKFQSETIVETFPAQGPVKTKILGDINKETEMSAARVREDMNHMLTDEMPEYRPEHERLLWSLPLAGSAFKKVWQDPNKPQPVTQFVPADDFVVSYGATDLRSAERYTHRMKKTPNEVLKLQLAGFYDPEVKLEAAVAGDSDGDDLEDARNEYTGLDPAEDTRNTLLELHVDVDLIGFEDVGEDGTATGLELPYVITIDQGSSQILSIYRNWVEGDIEREKRIHFSHYTYIPGFGFYGFGLIHLLGGFTKGATSIMRQLVDAGTLSNLPGGFKTRGMRIVGGDHPVTPGEFRDTDVPTGTLKENIMPLPYKEPSLVLFELLKAVVDEGRRFAAVADVNIADMQPNAPVGSTLAILERTLKTMTAVHARVHAAMKHEFQLMKDIVADMAPTQGAEYDYNAFGKPQAGKPRQARQQDYAVVEIIPVSDPNASTMSQRIVMYQAALQLMQMNPGIYDEPLLHRNMLETLGMKDADKLVPDKSEIPPADPVTENMNIIMGAPVKAEPTQNHQAHFTVHTAAAEDPQLQQMLQQQGPTGQSKVAAYYAHLNEHMAYIYREKIEQQLGQKLPPVEQQLPPEIENQLAAAMADASRQVLLNSQQEQAQQKTAEEEADPLNIIQREELNVKKGDLARKARKDEMDYKIDMATVQTKAAQAEWQDENAQDKLMAEVNQTMQNDAFQRDRTAVDAAVRKEQIASTERTAARTASQAAAAQKRSERGSADKGKSE